MKTVKYIALGLGVAMLASCSDLLDTAPEGSIITEEQKSEVVDNDPTRAEAGVNAIFAQMTHYDILDRASADLDRHNDIGYPGVMLRMDVNGNDVVGSTNGYNWFGNELDYSDRVYTSLEVQIIWNSLYAQIYASNNVAAAIDPETEDSLSQYYLAQALGARAFSYWVLAQLFQFNYVGHEDAPCVPLITDENAGAVGVEGCPRATVAEVYELIMSDLDTAVALLESTSQRPADKRYVSKAVAYGLRARVNLTMQKWAEAAADAQAAIEAFGGRPYTMDECADPKFMTAFWNEADAPIMWAVVVDATDRVVTTGICNWPSHFHSLCYGYNSYSGGFQISKSLYDMIPATDARKCWWTDGEGYSSRLAANDEAAEYFESAGYAPYTNVKFGPDQGTIGQQNNANDVPLMRVEEMYLIKAEGLAMSGSTSEAAQTLESFVSTWRDPQYKCKATTAEALQEEIFTQRRIELWGEGMTWFDILRLNKDVDRRGAGYADPSVVFNIPAGSDVLLYRIPQSEIEANPMLTDTDNNKADDPTRYVVADEE